MKITLQHYDQIASVENKYDDLSIDDVVNDLVIPLLKASGYIGVEEHFKQYED